MNRFEQGVYTQQKAKIRINGDLTEDIPTEKGTRQRCPLSPLLVILSLEVMNSLVKNNRYIRHKDKRGRI